MLADGDDLYAPRLMASEVANALWRKARPGEIERGQIGVLTAATPELPVRGRSPSGGRARSPGP